ncbi:MAG: ATP-dependent Clp protease ATP-binding subunit [Ruminococcaceae bacterium]|nr:ATP-dependent Clp protease ATP-binding subunit [Oscillospiraceae bacterium]
MKMCTVCQKNPAVVFVTKMEGTNRINEGYCLKCALEKGITTKDQLAEQIGMTPEMLDEMLENGAINLGGFDPGELMDSFQEFLQGSNLMEMAGEMDDEEDDDQTIGKIPLNDKNAKKNIKNEKNKRKCLSNFGVNLTDKAKKELLDKVVGREREIERAIQILNRRTKNNPVLLGAPGVGKTAIAEGIAQRIVSGKVPERLIDAEVYLLDMSSVVAGTQYRGQFESRMKNIIEEAKSGNIILVIDEIHSITKAGDADGAMNAGNILKPALSKGEIQVIGATTPDEYRKHIQKDAALERRFQSVTVDEPSRKDTLRILTGIKEYYENYHNVTISDDVLKDVIDLSCKYIANRFLPDKAIDIIDEAASKINIENPYSEKIIALAKETKELGYEIEKLEEDTENTQFEEIAKLKSEKCKKETEIDELRSLQKKQTVSLNDVAKVIELWTSIPVDSIKQSDKEKLLNLEAKLHERVIGQDKAVEAVSKAVRRNRMLKRSKKRPVSFMFIGPTGVGKTELVKALAESLFDDESSLIRLDMSEYMEKHAVSKIIGSPPGYVGYDEAGQLTEKVRNKPYSVILLDEIEKAHHDIFNILLQILDDGRITDSQGRLINFENTIIIMTSNAGTSVGANSMGFNQSTVSGLNAKIDTAIKEIFRPEFLNRIDEIIEFSELTKDELIKIVDLMLKDLIEELEYMGMKFTITEDAKKKIIDNSYNPKYGARPIRREIQKSVEDPITDALFREDDTHSKTVSVKVKNDKISVEIK